MYRNGELDAEKRIYPGGAFDPLALASDNSERTSKLREAEIKHGRLAMIAFLVRIYNLRRATAFSQAFFVCEKLREGM